MTKSIGKIKRVPLREVWRHEAHDFTHWLQENIDLLGDIVDIELSGAEREKAAGAFSVDIVAEDTDGNAVVIENQLEKSNHDHLGKVITYLVAMDAKTAIWVVSEPRPEHVASIAWLNESSAANFYLIKLEAISIGASDPAPLLTLIVGPSDEGKAVGKAKQEIADRYPLRRRFWAELLEQSKKKTKLHSNVSPSQYNWIGTSAGISGIGYNYVIRKNEAQVELYIDLGKEKETENRAFFDSLISNKSKIEGVFGDSLEWQSLEGKRACRIRYTLSKGGYRSDEETWPDIYNSMIDSMIRLEHAVSEHLETAVHRARE